MAVSIDEYIMIYVWLCVWVCVECRVADKRNEDEDEQNVHWAEGIWSASS